MVIQPLQLALLLPRNVRDNEEVLLFNLLIAGRFSYLDMQGNHLQILSHWTSRNPFSRGPQRLYILLAPFLCLGSSKRLLFVFCLEMRWFQR